MQVTLLESTPNPQALCEKVAAVCRNSTPTRDYCILKNALGMGHDGISEAADFVFLVVDISRAATHQLVRHRIASYWQQSQRHVKPEGVDWFHIPYSIRKNWGVMNKYIKHMNTVGDFYDYLINEGVPMEDARYVLPNATHSTIALKMNARTLDEFFRKRCCNRAQEEIRDLAEDMLLICRGVAPELFKGPYPDCANCKEPCENSSV